MKCPVCGKNALCIDSRTYDKYRRRKYRCSCGWRIVTREYPESDWKDMVERYKNSIL